MCWNSGWGRCRWFRVAGTVNARAAHPIFRVRRAGEVRGTQESGAGAGTPAFPNDQTSRARSPGRRRGAEMTADTTNPSPGPPPTDPARGPEPAADPATPAARTTALPGLRGGG